MSNATNPAIFNWNGPLGLPRFDEIKSTDFAAAFDQALVDDRKDIDAIADNPADPDFTNTIEALELAGEDLSRVSGIFWNLVGANSDDVLQELQREMSSKLSRHFSQTAANTKLFKRVDVLWQGRKSLNLTMEQERVLERKWKGFVRAGAALSKTEQEKLANVNSRLAELGANFSQNILGDEKEWVLVLNKEEDLAGLPDFVISAMASAATERGHSGAHAVTLSRSIIVPFLMFSDRRELREEAFKAWGARGENQGERDNRPLVKEIVELRQERAGLLGYASFADYKLEDQMAKKPEAVTELLERVWDRALIKATEEEQELAALIAESGANHAVEPWDWRYYAEKVRTQKFAFDEAEVKPYLSLDNMIAAAFDVANRLFGVSIEEKQGIPTYHQDVRVFEVTNPDGSHRAVFLGDYFARPSKRSGAWMSAFQGQHKLVANGNTGQTPIIVNVMNFAKAPEGQPTLLSMDDARTLFHEFGHALHGILSDVIYPSVSGTAVARDFVELPSQVFEHWLTVPEILSKHARHIETGEPIPQHLLDKVLAAQTFNAGFDTIEFTASALVDMAFHKAHDKPIEDVMAFQDEVLHKIGLPSSIVMRHATPHFAHVFSGDGYSAGYYSYMWSEVLDADAFAAFEERDNPFDAKIAERLHDHIYSIGGSVDPEQTYLAFRGKMPNPDAMMEKRGLG